MPKHYGPRLIPNPGTNGSVSPERVPVVLAE